MEKIVQGVRKFQRDVFGTQRTFFEALAAKKQTPQALFITCSDSRINPNLITQTEPGELFILRNAGNIVPPYGAAWGGEGATIEYAVSALGLKSIIICGHLHCGAMHSLLAGLDDPREMPAVSAWFNHAEATRRIMRSKFSNLTGNNLALRCAEQNVLVQIDNLRTHPSVSSGLSSGELHVYGWVYVIETGEVRAYDPETRCFNSLTANVDAAVVPIPSNSRLSEANAMEVA